MSAPAGSGKTALLTEWLDGANAPDRVAKVALDPDLDDRAEFWREVCAALPQMGSQPTGPAELAEAVAELAEPLVLVLDDFEAMRLPEVAADLDWLIERAPQLHLVIATRRDPALRLERLRLAGKMTEVRAADLAFTLDEARELLGPLELSDADVELLWRRTEGWVGGLRLAQLSLEGRTDRHAFVTSFAGDDRAVSDYLMSEVVERQPPDVLDFLLRTCVADRLSGRLADALTGGEEGTRTLRAIERVDGLVTTADGHGRWYRYQPLLREVLRAESRRRLADEQPELHRRAGRWHADHGSALEAVRHAIEAADWDLAADIIGARWLVFVTRGAGSSLRELVEHIPPDVVRGDAELALALAGLLLEAGDDPAADELLVEAYRLVGELPPERARRFAVAATATDLYRARLRGDLEEAVSAARLVLDGTWDRDLAIEMRALALANLGIAELWAGEGDAAGEHLQQAAGLALECSNDFVLLLAETYASAVDATAGRLNEAWTRGRTAIQLAERRGWTDVAHLAMAYATLGSVHLWRGEVDEAERLTERAGAALGRSREPLLGPAVALLHAALLALKGEPVSALDVVGGAMAQRPLPKLLEVAARALEAELWLALGEPARAEQRLADPRDYSSDTAIGIARLRLAQGAPAAALRALADFSADEALVPFAGVEVRVLEAIARDALRDEAGALEALEQALDMAEPRGCTVVILRYGAPARSLLRRLAARGTRHRALVDELQGRLERSSPQRVALAPLLEPLSERELTVLRYLPTMMSNAEIAAEMFVSVNTVKTHLKHIYRKLDVDDRRDCVRRGRELRLLAPGLGDG